MEGYDESTYGQRWSPYYDDIYDRVDDSLIDSHDVVGEQAEDAAWMSSGSTHPRTWWARMRAKPGGEAIAVTIGDFANVGVAGTFPLIYLTFNTIFWLLTQERQIECFQNVAAHLEPGGRFIIDCFVPDVRRFDHNNTRIGVSSIDSVDQHSYETDRSTNHVSVYRKPGWLRRLLRQPLRRPERRSVPSPLPCRSP